MPRTALQKFVQEFVGNRHRPCSSQETWTRSAIHIRPDTGLQRTWLDPSGERKAQIATPRRAMCDLLGHAVRFGPTQDILGVGEGIETTLSARAALPGLPVAAALSAAHLAAIRFPPALRRLYILRDNDPAGTAAARC